MAKVHRFYVADHIKLKKDFWLHDESLIWQWTKVLRLREGEKISLFDDAQTERLYTLDRVKKTEIHLVMITEMEPKIPKKNVYLFWSLLKKDNNEHILQKATELGVSNFVPLITDRTIKKDFNYDRAKKIVIEASEQCGRTSIPHVREPVHIAKALEEYKDKMVIYVCQQDNEAPQIHETKLGLLIGPEGGWTDEELKFFKDAGYPHIGLGDFTLRAETAAITAAGKVL